MNHVDVFGNLIEKGDVVKRICNGMCYTTEIMAIRPSGIGINRVSYNWVEINGVFKCNITKSKVIKPLWLDRWQTKNQIINLSKLDNSKIQETIKSFINEI